MISKKGSNRVKAKIEGRELYKIGISYEEQLQIRLTVNRHASDTQRLPVPDRHVNTLFDRQVLELSPQKHG